MVANVIVLRRTFSPEQVERAMNELVVTLMHELDTTDALPALQAPVSLAAVFADLATELGMPAPTFLTLLD